MWFQWAALSHDLPHAERFLSALNAAASPHRRHLNLTHAHDGTRHLRPTYTVAVADTLTRRAYRVDTLCYRIELPVKQGQSNVDTLDAHTLAMQVRHFSARYSVKRTLLKPD
jgi:hypothetical protein